MSLAKRYVFVLLACCAHRIESGRARVGGQSARSNAGLASPLSSMLLANPSSAGWSQSKVGSARAPLPKSMQAVAQLHVQGGLLGSGLISKPNQVKTLYDNAKILSNLGLHDKAAPLHNLCQNLMDSGHNSLEAYRRKLRTQLRRADDQDVNLMKDVFQFKLQKLGKSHPKTLKSHHNYADVLGQVGRHAEAEPLKKELLTLRRHALGPEHLETVQAMRSYAETLMELSRVSEVSALQKQALEIAVRTLGPDHPETIQVVSDYAATLAKIPDADAEPLWKDFAQLVEQHSLNAFCSHLQASPCAHKVPDVVVKQCSKQPLLT